MEKIYKNGDKHLTKKDRIFWSYIAGGAKEQWCSIKGYNKKIKKRKIYQKSQKSIDYQREWYLKNKEKKKIQSENNRTKRMQNAPLRCLFSSCKGSNKRRRFEFKITPEFIESLWIKQNGICFYTGIQMKYDAFKKDPLQVSIDRVDSSIDYIESNVVLCCQAINYMKNSYTMDQFNNLLYKLQATLKEIKIK